MTNQAPATLYGYYRSSTSYRARIALNLKQIAFTTVDIRLDQGDQLSEAFRERNPMGAVPVLEIDGLSLLQSPAILDYLEEHYPDPRLLPEPAPARQRVRELSALVGCDIHPVNNLRILKYLRREFEADDARIAEWYRHWIAEGFSAYEKLLGATDRTAGFCVGAATSMAEIYLLPQIYNARRFDLDMTPYPRIAEIEARCLDLSEFRNAHPDQSKP